MNTLTLLYLIEIIGFIALIVYVIERKWFSYKGLFLLITGLLMIAATYKFASPKQEKIEVIVGPDIFEVLNIKEQTQDKRYLHLVGKLNNKISRIVYDTLTGDIIEEAGLFEKKAVFSVNVDGSDLELIDNEKKEVIFSVDLLSYGFEKVNTTVKIERILWSSTDQYCFITQYLQNKLRPSLLIDVQNKRCVKLPIVGVFEIGWSSDDKKAILRYLTDSKISDSKVSKIAFWDIEKNHFQTIQFVGQWVPDSYYVFSNHLERYDMANDFKKDYIRVKKNMLDETMKWVTEDEVVFISEGENFRITDLIPGVNSYVRFLDPNTYHANKLDFKKMKSKEITINAQSSLDYYWSIDYNWLYYVNNSHGTKKGLYKMYVGFGN